MIDVTFFIDPGCPWSYSANPALLLLRWRYGDQLSWRMTTIGLAEDPERYQRRGHTPAGSAQGYRAFRALAMPFCTQPRRRMVATAPACRAIVATRLLAPEHQWAVLRELQFGWFARALVMDEGDALRAALGEVPDLDVEGLMAAIDSEEVAGAYREDKVTTRGAAGGPADAQGRTANTDGEIRYTSPSLIFTHGEDVLEAGGFQPVEAYDVIVANLDRTLNRRPPAGGAREALEQFTHGLTTFEVATVMAGHLKPLDRAAAEDELIALTGEGIVRRRALGDDALWSLPATAR